MECINCTQCIDACDDVMEKVGSPTGLIRFCTHDSIFGKAKKLLRARTVVYPLILMALMSGLVYAVSTKSGFDARIMRRSGGNPFTVYPNGTASNEFRLRLVNRTGDPQTYSITPGEDAGYEIEVMDPEKLSLDPGESTLIPLHITFKGQLTRGPGRQDVTAVISDGSDNVRDVKFSLLGPR